MGLFSGLKKMVKKIFKGVKKVFKKVGSFVGKILGSKWGKVLLTAAAVFTGGMAIAAGIGGFTGSTATTFLGKFVAGAKGFVGALLNPIGAGKGALAGVQGGGGFMGAAQGAAQGQGIFNIAGVTDAVTQGAGAATQAVAQNPSEALGAGGAQAPSVGPAADTAGLSKLEAMNAANAAKAAVPAAAPAAQPGMLSRAAGAFGDFAKSTGGGLILSNAAMGLAQGKAQEDMLKHGDYYDRQWADPRQQMILETASQYRPRVPSGYMERARRLYSEGMGTSGRGYRFGTDEQRGYASGVTGG